MATLILRPNSTEVNQWVGGSHLDVDEVVVDPTAGDDNHWYATFANGDDDDLIEMGFPTSGVPVTITSIQVKTNGRSVGVPDPKPFVNIYIGGAWQTEQQCMIPYSSDGWENPLGPNIFSGIWHNADLDGLKVRYRANVEVSGRANYLDVVYVIVTYTTTWIDELRPNANVQFTWAGGSGQPDVDEVVFQPLVGDAVVSVATYAGGDADEEWMMSFPTFSVISVSQIKTWVYGRCLEPIYGDKPDISVSNNGVDWEIDQDCNVPDNMIQSAWTSNTFSVSWDQSDLDGLQLMLRARLYDPGKAPGGSITIDTVYVEVTYIPGYRHDFIGVPAANIGSVMGVPNANIDNIIGV